MHIILPHQIGEIRGDGLADSLANVLANEIANSLANASTFLLTFGTKLIEQYPAMFRKPLPPAKDVEALAKQFGGLWKAGDIIRPYLREHAELFRERQKKGWSWEALALAMNAAEITYETGQPWSATALMQAFSRAQSPLKGYARRGKKRITDDPVVASNVPVSQSVSTIPDHMPTDLDEPEFKIARFIDWDESARSPANETRQQTTSNSPSPHYIEIMEQLTGKKPVS
jgi:hypothetical protein